MYRQFHEVREAFYKEHGEYVVTPQGPVIFKDGAVDENSFGGKGPLIDPPTDEWERAKLQLLFWELKAEKAKQAFKEYRMHLNGNLNGNGRCPPEAERFHSDQQHLDLLARFKKRYETAKRYMRAAREAADDAEPEKFKRLRRADAEQQARKKDFSDKVNRIRI